VTATNYTDTGLSNGTTYYYVVSAVNAVGEGPDSSEIKAAPIQASAPNVYQSENGTWDAAGVAETTNAGYTGASYVNTGNAVGAYSEVTVTVATAGSYSIDIRYANGTTVDRPADLSINGTVVQAAVSFPGTGAWTTWSDVVVTKTLNAGNNTIRLTATTANGDANLDKVTISPVAGPVVVQSETGTWDAAGVLETVNAGYIGAGYVNTGNAIGAYSEVTVNVATAGTYSIDFRYANGGTVDRPADLSINGTVVQAAVSFPATGAWTTWSDVIVTKTLNAGNNTIRLTATTANGDANLDEVTVQ
jgi:hypothetical protein